MSDSPRSPDALLKRARGARPDDETRRRIRAGLDAKLGLIASAGIAAGTIAGGSAAAAEGATASVAGAAAKVGLFGAGAKVGLAIGVVAVTGAGVHSWLTPSPEAPTVTTAMVVESTVSTEKSPESQAPLSSATGAEIPAPSASVEASLASAQPKAGPLPVGGRRDAASIAAEVALLRKAQASLREGDGDASLKTIDALAAKHPDGALREERDAARVFALCAAGRQDDARIEALRFLARYPSSVQVPGVRASCAFAPKKPR